MSIEEHATMTGEDRFAAKSGPRMTLDYVMELAGQQISARFYTDREMLRLSEKIQAYAAEQVAEYKQDAERYAFAKTIEGQALVIKVFFEIGAQGLDPAIDAAIRARAQEE